MSLKVLFVLSFVIVLVNTKCTSVSNANLSNDELIGQYLGKTDLIDAFLKIIPKSQSLEEYLNAIRHEATVDSVTHSTSSWERALLLLSLYEEKMPEYYCALVQMVKNALDNEKTGNKLSLTESIDLNYAIIKETLRRLQRISLRALGCTVSEDVARTAKPECYADDAVILKEYQGLISQRFTEKLKEEDIYGKIVNGFADSKDERLKLAAGQSLLVEANELWIANKKLDDDPTVVNVSVRMVEFMQTVAFHDKCDCKETESVVRESADRLSDAIFEMGNTLKKVNNA